MTALELLSLGPLPAVELTNPRRLEDVAGVVRGFRFELTGFESSSGVEVAAVATWGQ